MNLLFICSQNKWRSRTAETIFRDNGQHKVLSAGTRKGAVVSINAKLLRWADMVFVMEDHHRKYLLKFFPHDLSHAQLITLDIPDEYPYMHPTLVEILQEAVKPFIDL